MQNGSWGVTQISLYLQSSYSASLLRNFNTAANLLSDLHSIDPVHFMAGQRKQVITMKHPIQRQIQDRRTSLFAIFSSLKKKGLVFVNFH